MEDKRNDLQIAAFIVLSLAISSPQTIAGVEMMTPMDNQAQVYNVLRYAGPPNPSIQTTDIIQTEPLICRYAGPPMQIQEIKIIEPQNVVPPIVRYAGPPSTLIEDVPAKVNILNSADTIAVQQSPVMTKTDLGNMNSKVETELKAINSAGVNSFINTDYGSVKVIQPFSHYIFK